MKAHRLVTATVAPLLIATLLSANFLLVTPVVPVTGIATGAVVPPCAADPAAPKRQFRASWIASVNNIDWPSRASRSAPDRIAARQAEYRCWLDLAQRLNHNAVIVQVRPTADAFWPSPHEHRPADPLGSAPSGPRSYDANHADTRTWVRREWSTCRARPGRTQVIRLFRRLSTKVNVR